jgi:polysaccharide export outer membrane protein
MLRDYVLSAVLLILACVLPLRAQSVLPKVTESSPGPSAHALQISAGDLLDLNVFDTPELSGKLRVDEHGNVSLPLAGVLAVSGMTAEQAGSAIETRLRETDILKDPHVSVAVLEYATQGVTVTGEVKSPGVYPLLGVHGVLDLISAAGGVTPNAGNSVTVTHRADPDHPVVVKVDSKPGSSAALRVDISPGDTIMVSHAGIVYVVGDVGKPGGFLIQNNDRLTVLQAVALAQGTNRTASLDRAKLIRKTEAGRQEVPVSLKKMLTSKTPDLMLADGDILFVPSSAAKNALRTVESVLPSVASAAIYRTP